MIASNQTGKQLNFAGIFPPEKSEEEIQKSFSPAVSRRRSGRVSSVKGLHVDDEVAAPKKATKVALKSKETETVDDKDKETVIDVADRTVDFDITENDEKTTTSGPLEKKNITSHTTKASSDVKPSKRKQDSLEAVNPVAKEDALTNEKDNVIPSAKKDNELQKSTKDSDTPKSKAKKAITPKSQVKRGVKTRRTRMGGPDVDVEVESSLMKKVASSVKGKSKTAKENTDVTTIQPSESEMKNENADPQSSLNKKKDSKMSEMAFPPDKSSKSSNDEHVKTVSSKPVDVNDKVTPKTFEGPKHSELTTDDVKHPDEIQILTPVKKTYPGKKKCPASGDSVARYSSGESDYADEDLEQELLRTSIILQNSLKDCILERIEDSQILSESSRRKNLTPSKKTIEDVRKALKGKASVGKSTSKCSSPKGKTTLVENQSYPVMCSPNSKKKLPFKEVETMPSVSKDVTEVSMNSLNGDLSETESEEAVPSSQENDEPLAQMAEILAISRQNAGNVTKNIQPVVESDATNEKIPCGRGKRKRSLVDDDEDNGKEQKKRKKDADIEEDLLSDDMDQSVEGSFDENEKILTTSETEGDDENLKKLGKYKRSLDSTQDVSGSQNSCDLFEAIPQATTPPKITRSGRKIVAPKKDMPEPMTPPGSSSAKKKKDMLERMTPTENILAKRKKVSEPSDSSKSKGSPSLLSGPQSLDDSSEEKERTSLEKSSSSEKKNCAVVTAVGDDVPQVVELEAAAKKNVQKKITDMFAKEKKSLTGEKTLPEMEKVENEIHGKKQNILDSDETPSLEKCFTGFNESADNSTVVESLSNKKRSKESSDKILEDAKSVEVQDVEPLASPLKIHEPSKISSESPLRSASNRSPLKKRVTLFTDLNEVVKENKSDSTSPKCVEILTCIPESIDLDEIGSSIENGNSCTNTGKVLSPKKKWAQTVKETEMATLGEEENTKPSRSIMSKEVACDLISRSFVDQQQSPRKAEPSDLLEKNMGSVCDEELSPSNRDKNATLQKNSVEPVESDDDDSDIEVDIEMVDVEESSKETCDSSNLKGHDVIDISSSASPVNRESHEKSGEILCKKPEETQGVDEESNVIVLSSDSKSESSDETSKRNSKSSESSSLENAQRVDDELKEVDRKSMRSPKKDKSEKIVSSNVEEKFSEEESSPEKLSGSKFTHTIGTPERKKKLASMKYAGSRAAMLVACAKQNIRNRTTEGDSPSKLSLGGKLYTTCGRLSLFSR